MSVTDAERLAERRELLHLSDRLAHFVALHAAVCEQRDEAMGWRQSLTDQCLALQAQRDALAAALRALLARECPFPGRCDDAEHVAALAALKALEKTP